MSDEKFEEFLQREAPAYNTPPAGNAPRDEMWQVIAAARAGRASAAAPLAEPSVTAITGRPRRWRMAPWIGMAATLLIGVGIGRFALGTKAVEPPGSGTDVAANATPPFLVAPTSTPAAEPVTPAAPANAPSAGATDAAPRRLAPSGAPPVRFVSVPASALDPNAPMQVASREHLVRAEALISVVAASAADLAIDSLTSRWAREMLTSTRLLIDSPAGEDPARRLLLEDLETVLVLLVQRSGAPADERALFDRSLERTQLLTRLRTNAGGL